MSAELPYGSWPSPIDAADLVTGASTPTDTWAEAGVTWWSRTRPDQGGRVELVRRDADGTVHEDVFPGGNVRTRVHEYGGGAWWVHDGVVFAVDWADQRLHRLLDGDAPVPLTPEPSVPAGLRYADGRVTPDGSTVICVRESHHGDDVRNEIVALPAVPGPDGPAEPVVLVTGPDFVAAPRISADGRELTWIEWDHPNMPWDTTRLWRATLTTVDGVLDLADARRVVANAGESVVQPEWAPDGTLHAVSDRSDWWNVYRLAEGEPVAVHPVAAEVGLPAWGFGQSRYVLGAGSTWVTWSDAEGAHLLRVAVEGSSYEETLPYVGLTALRLDGDRLVAIAAQATAEAALVELRLLGDRFAVQVLAEAEPHGLPEAAISTARAVTFPSAGGREAHAQLFLPASEVARGPKRERPPLLVTIHGGPTGAASRAFGLGTQYWTTRGFAVLAVDYGGSTGYGRPYRRLLDGQWGIVDVEDACAAATWAAGQGYADEDRLLIRGGSAGGYTVLACLATQDVFAAGCDMFGVADLAALARDTHKFESRYLDGLIGPWPEAEAVYTERSPLAHVDGFDRPLIVLQGDQDAVVPPSQSEMIVAALAAKEVPHAYLLFAGEQHGFRKAENIVRALEAELSFYAQVFGFTPAGDIEPVEIAYLA